jgi:quinol monooxygenase YgiN
MGKLRLSARLSIKEGKLDELRALAAQALAVVREQDPAGLEYEWHISADGKTCVVTETWTSSQGLLDHFAHLGPVLGKLGEVATITVDIFGDPSPALLEAMAGLSPKVYGHFAGLDVAPKLEPHPLDGTFNYFDSQLAIQVGPVTVIEQYGLRYAGRFTFTGTYSVELSTGERYYWPVVGGTINELKISGGQPPTDTGYEIAFSIFSPNVRPPDPTYGNTDLSRFIDGWGGYAGVDPNGLVNNLQIRFLNVTFVPEDDSAASDVKAKIAAGRPFGLGRHLLGQSPGWSKGADKQLPPLRTAWSAFSWQPTWEDFGARSYIRMK